MSKWRTVGAKLLTSVRLFPTDLAIVVGLTILTILIILSSSISDTFFRIFFGLTFVLFLPGYAFIAALFPKEGAPSESRHNRHSENEAGDINAPLWAHGIDRLERIALSVGVSISIVPLISLMLNFTPEGLRLKPIVLIIGGFTIVCATIAAVRRQRVPEEDRFIISVGNWFVLARTEFVHSDNRIDKALNTLLLIMLLFAVISIGYTIMAPAEEDQFTEFYLLTEGEDGRLIAENYPAEFTDGEGHSLIVAISNHEYETTDYTVIVQLQRVETDGDETRVLERHELQRFQTRLAHNETWYHEHEITPSMHGEDLQLTYFLYKEESPEEPTQENSYRNLHLWIDVNDDSEINRPEPNNTDEDNEDNEAGTTV